MKLSKRLKQIEQMVGPGYEQIWDCCCDHGFLGAALLARNAANKIHFVDIVPPIITKLESQLESFYSDSQANWQTHCIDVKKIPLQQYTGKQLVIIAGVGGDLMIEFIEAIQNKHSQLELDFLLSPVHHQFALRENLIKHSFHLMDEVLIEQNRRFYEILLVSTSKHAKLKISPIGNKIWQASSTEQLAVAQRYLSKTLNHYLRIQQGKKFNVERIISAYRTIKL